MWRERASEHSEKRRTQREQSSAERRGEESEAGRKVTRSARDRGSGAAETHWGLFSPGAAGYSNKQHRRRVISQEGIEGVL